jgi:hypothetical protein
MDTIRRQGEDKIVERLGNDPAFRSELMGNPAEAVSSTTGWQIPSGVTIKVIEETADTFYLVIPHMEAEMEDGELSDEMLENVAGGSRRCNRQTWTCKCTL